MVHQDAHEVAGRNPDPRRYTYYRPAILLLLKEQRSHGYEVLGRLSELGLEAEHAASLYGVLRAMEKCGLLESSWEASQCGGPPRRIYAPTIKGDQYLDDAETLLVQQRDAITVMLDRYRAIKRRSRRPARRLT